MDRIKIKHPSGWAGIHPDAFDPEKHELYEEAPEFDIDAMAGADLTELLEAHGVEDIPHKLDDRRALLKRVMFI